MSSAPIVPARLDWPSAIGSFLLNFGVLDYLVVVYLKDHLEFAEFSKLKEWHLKDRLSRVAEHLRNSGCTAETTERVADVLTRLNPIRDLRNHLAHGHLLLNLNVEGQAFEIVISQPKDLDQEYSPEARHVTFDELQARLSELTELIEAFKGIVGFSNPQ